MCISNCVKEQKLSAVTAVEIAAGAICMEQLIWARSRGHIHNNILLSPGPARLSGFMSVCFGHVCDCVCVCVHVFVTV